MDWRIRGSDILIKQFTLEPLFGKTLYKFSLYETGVCVKWFIIRNYEIPKYSNWAESCGYEEAYDEDYYLDKFRAAELAYQEATADLSYARDHRLIKCDISESSE